MATIIENRKKINKDDIEFITGLENHNGIYNVILSNNEEYYFKDFSLIEKENIYNELLSSYLAKQVGIRCVNSKVASINNSNKKYNEKIGLLEESYLEQGYKSYVGYDIMENYLDYLIENNIISIDEKYLNGELSKTDYMSLNMNNLKCIYDSLKYFFKEYENSDELVEEIFTEIIKRFSFDYITMQGDRSLNNWSILVGVNKHPKLAKMYDNEYAFSFEYTPEQKVINQNENTNEILENFFNNEFFNKTFSSKKIKEFHNIFIEVYKNLTPDTFFELLVRMEYINGEFESVRYKNDLIEKYEQNYERITNYLEKINMIDKKYNR